MDRRAVIIGLPLFLASCAAAPDNAPLDSMQRFFYAHPGPKSVTLITVKNTESENGAHTALMINASQRVIFDPAGTFRSSTVPSRNDLIFGVNDQVSELYDSFHARSRFYVIRQTVVVSPEVAEQALQLAIAKPTIPKANCTRATAQLLRQLPGFGQIGVSFFPDNLMAQFAQLPGVVTTEYREDDDDDDDKSRALGQIEEAITTGAVTPGQ